MIYGVVKNQKLDIRAAAASDTIDYLTAKFTFLSPDWDGLVKYAHFQQGATRYSVQLINDNVGETEHLNLGAGEWTVYLHGNEYRDGDVIKRITTNIAKFKVEPTGVLDGDPFPEAEPSIVEQLAAQIEEFGEEIGDFADDIEALQTGKVDKETGKGLSSNDYTDEEKQKLADLSVGAAEEIYDISTNKLKFSPAEVAQKWNDRVELRYNKNVVIGLTYRLGHSISIFYLEKNLNERIVLKYATYLWNQTTPYSDLQTGIIPEALSQLTNDAGFITKAVNDLENYYLKTELYTKTEVNNIIAGLETVSFEIVQELPVTGEPNIIYLVPASEAETQNYYEEYIYLSNSWELIGSTQVDLTGYATEVWVQSQGYADETETNQKISAVDKKITAPNLADGATFSSGYAINWSTGKRYSSSLAASSYVDVTGVSEIIYPRILSTSTATSATFGMAFYSAASESSYISGQKALTKYASLGLEYTRIAVPTGAKFARFTYAPAVLGTMYVWDSSEYDESLTVRVENLENKLSDELPLGLHTMPGNEGVLNVIKRCRQLTDIKWVPAVDLPRMMMTWRGRNEGESEEYEGKFRKGVEYTGIPYGRANDMDDYGYDYGFVGSYINFETFISAVSNPQSIVAKESEFNLTDHESVKYAMVCSALTCYALNVPYVPTASIPSITGLNLVGKINNNGTRLDDSNFMLGDVLNLPGYHTAVITDIIRDENGVVSIELSDASMSGLADKNYADGDFGGVCRRKGWSIEDIYTLWGEYNLMRFTGIADVPYTPSKYVNVGDEMDMQRAVHYPCMPYCGENFTYKAGYIPNTDVVISPNLGYSYLRVFKDGTELAASPFTVSGNKVTVGFSETGNYEAYLCNMENGEDTTVTMKCHWRVE